MSYHLYFIFHAPVTPSAIHTTKLHLYVVFLSKYIIVQTVELSHVIPIGTQLLPTLIEPLTSSVAFGVVVLIHALNLFLSVELSRLLKYRKPQLMVQTASSLLHMIS